MSKSAQALLGGIAVWSTVCVAEAQEPVAETKPRVGIATNSSVVRQHRPGAWSVLAVNATNYTDEAGEGLISVFFPPETGRQFARRVWVPAHAQRITWLPIRRRLQQKIFTA